MRIVRIPGDDKGRFGRCVWGRICAEQAGALVELALVLPVFVVLLVGAGEFARAEYAAIEVSNAAMAGVQYGGESADAAADLNGIQQAAANDAGNITLGTTSASVSCICSDGSASTCQPTDCSGSNIEQILTVQTQTTFDPLIHLPGIPKTFTLNGQAVQKVLQ
ncbi:MAG: TadE/TadG family type IV pilus assembly protein [Acidobacteriaceae bacterium]